MDTAIRLTADQEDIARLPADARVLVTAGAGTGKTHVLAARWAELLASGGLTYDQVLILSFSRAAVAAVRARTHWTPVGFRANAVTFDSFATGLLASVRSDDGWRSLGYDARIEATIRLLQDDPTGKVEFANYRHLLVDEIQDLVGCRARLVMALLSETHGGFTLFGDPAQSIYGFQEGDEGGLEDGPGLVEWIRSRFRGQLLEQRLSENFRALSPRVRQVLPFGRLLQAETPDYPTILSKLETLILQLPPVGDIALAIPMLTRADGKTTAVLCRTNGEALIASRVLFDHGVRHTLQPRAADRIAPAWLASALTGFSSPRVGRARVMERLESLAAPDLPPPIDMWAQLKQLDRRRSDDLDVRIIAGRIHDGAIPEDLDTGTPDRVLVSSIHRAKGLEFDRVILVESDCRAGTESSPDRARLLYVALTRARSELYTLRALSTRGMHKLAPAGGRWVREEFRGPRRSVVAFEVCGVDADSLAPAGLQWPVSVNVLELQAYLRTDVRRGDAVTLRVCEAPRDPQTPPLILIYHVDRPIGAASSSFADLLGRALRRSGAVRWPRRISGLHIECVDAVAGEGSVGAACGLGNAGIWCRARVVGLGDLYFE